MSLALAGRVGQHVCVSLVPVADRMLDEAQFLSPFGIRSLSKEHEAAPYHFESRMTLLPRLLPRLCLSHVSLSHSCAHSYPAQPMCLMPWREHEAGLVGKRLSQTPAHVQCLETPV